RKASMGWTTYKGMDVPDTNPGEAGNKLTNDIKALADRTYGTTGSVIFIGASGAATQDNAKFFWDDTNDRLGIGTSSPAAPLSLMATTPQISFQDASNRFLTITGPTSANASIAVSNTGAGLDITTSSGGSIAFKISGNTLAQFTTGTSLSV